MGATTTDVMARYVEIVRGNRATCKVLVALTGDYDGDGLEVGAELVETAYDMGALIPGDSDDESEDIARDLFADTLRANRWRLVDMLAGDYDPIVTEVLPAIAHYSESVAAHVATGNPVSARYALAEIATLADDAQVYITTVANL